MARTNNLTNFLTDVADSIREKTGKSDPIPCEDFDTEIESISGGGEPNLQDKSVTITENGTTNITPDTGYDGLNAVTVNTQISGGAPIYTNVETVVGTWTDDKPLYMKTIVNTETTDSSGNFEDDINTNTANIDVIFLGENSYFMDESGSKSYAVNYVNITSGNVVTWNHCYPKTNGYIYTSSAGIFSANATIQCVYNIFYTKTTDNAVSNVNSIQGNHFSQTEHIVGEDLEGNTIYEKTIPVKTSNYRNYVPVNKTYAHGIGNIDKVWIADGSFFRSSATNQRFPVNYLNYNKSMYRQHARTSANNTNLYLYVGDWIVAQGTIYHYVTLRYTKT